jgi:hypothetical protein
MALEATTMPSFFLITSVWLWLKSKESSSKITFLILLSATIGLGANAYQSTKLIFFILAVLILFDTFSFKIENLKICLILCFFMILGAFPQIYMVIFESHKFFSRASYTMMSFSFSFEYFSNLARNILSNLSPEYLFFSFGYNNMSIARLIKIEFIFFYLGLIFFYKVLHPMTKFKAWNLYLLIFLAIFPSSLTVNNPQALRASSLVILYPMVTAAGFILLFNFLKNNKVKYAFLGIFIVLILLNSIKIIYKYLNSMKLINQSHQNELVKMSMKVNELKNNYSNIYIQNLGIQPYIYIASYSDLKPSQFQKTKKVYENLGVDKFHQLGKYYFFDKEKFSTSNLKPNGKNLIVFNSKKEGLNMVDSRDAYYEKFYFYKY